MLLLISLQLLLLVLLLLSINQLCYCYCYNTNNIKNKHYNNKEGLFLSLSTLLFRKNSIHHRFTILKQNTCKNVLDLKCQERLQLQQVPVVMARRQLFSKTRGTTTTLLSGVSSTNDIPTMLDDNNNNNNNIDGIKNDKSSSSTNNTTTNDTILSIGTFMFQRLFSRKMILNRFMKRFKNYFFNKNINNNENNSIVSSNPFINFKWDARINTNTGISGSNETSKQVLSLLQLSEDDDKKNFQGTELMEQLFTQLFVNYPVWLSQFNIVCKLLFVQQKKQQQLDNDDIDDNEDDLVKVISSSNNNYTYSIRTRIFNINLLTFGQPHVIHNNVQPQKQQQPTQQQHAQQEQEQEQQVVVQKQDDAESGKVSQQLVSTVQVHIPICGGLLAMPITGTSGSNGIKTTYNSRTAKKDDRNENNTMQQHDDTSIQNSKGSLMFTMRLHTSQQQQQRTSTASNSSTMPLVGYCCQIETKIVSCYQPTIGNIVSLLLLQKKQTTKKQLLLFVFLKRINSYFYLYTQSIIHAIVMWRFHKYCYDSLLSILLGSMLVSQ